MNTILEEIANGVHMPFILRQGKKMINDIDNYNQVRYK